MTSRIRWKRPSLMTGASRFTKTEFGLIIQGRPARDGPFHFHHVEGLLDSELAAGENWPMGISGKQLTQLRARLRNRPKSSALSAAPNRARFRSLLGIDPSLRGTGFGLLLEGASGFTSIMHGTIRCPTSWPQSRCLAQIAVTIRELIREHRPEACVVEGLFYAQNIKTALTMGHARGAAMAVAAEAGLPIFEIAPRKVKQAVVGFGGAGKIAVARMVQRRLGLAQAPAPDAADALAVALAFAQSQSALPLMSAEPI